MSCSTVASQLPAAVKPGARTSIAHRRRGLRIPSSALTLDLTRAISDDSQVCYSEYLLVATTNISIEYPAPQPRVSIYYYRIPYNFFSSLSDAVFLLQIQTSKQRSTQKPTISFGSEYTLFFDLTI